MGVLNFEVVKEFYNIVDSSQPIYTEVELHIKGRLLLLFVKLQLVILEIVIEKLLKHKIRGGPVQKKDKVTYSHEY